MARGRSLTPRGVSPSDSVSIRNSGDRKSLITLDAGGGSGTRRARSARESGSKRDSPVSSRRALTPRPLGGISAESEDPVAIVQVNVASNSFLSSEFFARL